MMEKENVATAVARGLRQAGINTVFGLPGGENVQLMEALRRLGVRFVLSEHESTATFMASAAAQLTRHPAACLTTLGPGAVNATAGLAHAFLDRCPLLLMTAQMPEDLQAIHSHQLVDLHRLYDPITKGSFRVTPQNARKVVAEAVRIASSGTPGPVHLQISNDVAALPVKMSDDEQPERVLVDQPDLVSAEAITRAADNLNAAQRPVVVVGLGVEPEAPYEDLLCFAEKLGAPVLTTPKAKGSVPADHRLGSETIGLTRTDPGYELIAESDYVVTVGMDVVEVVLPWSIAQPVLWLSSWYDKIGSGMADQALIGPLGPTLTGLTNLLSEQKNNWGSERVSHYRKMRLGRSHEASDRVQGGVIAPQAVLRAVRLTLPSDGVFTTDVGSHKVLSALEWDATVPNRYLVSNGLSAMGFGPAAAAGAALAGLSPVVCLTGDGGLLMCAGVLSSLSQIKVPVVIVVLLDGALDLIRAHQQRLGVEPFGTEFPAPDITRIGSAFGLQAATVATEANLSSELRRALGRSGASVIGVNIDPKCYRGSF